MYIQCCHCSTIKHDHHPLRSADNSALRSEPVLVPRAFILAENRLFSQSDRLDGVPPDDGVDNSVVTSGMYAYASGNNTLSGSNITYSNVSMNMNDTDAGIAKRSDPPPQSLFVGVGLVMMLVVVVIVGVVMCVRWVKMAENVQSDTYRTCDMTDDMTYNAL